LLLCTLESPSHFTTPSTPLAFGHSLFKSPQTCHAVAWHGLTMPSPSPFTSGLHHHAHWIPLTSLDALVPSLDREQAHTRQNASAQTRPGLAHAAPERAWHSLWTRQSVTSPASSHRLSPHAHHQSTPHLTVTRLDTLAGPRERRRRRELPRPSAMARKLPSRSPPL
jgi:hypothetical protein